MNQTIWWLIPVGATIGIVVLLIAREFRKPKRPDLQREVDLRLTYKRYLELYPDAKIPYREYKRMQAARAYKKAVSSTKIKRMVR